MAEIDEFKKFANLLDELHFNKYQNIFDILQEFKIVSSNKYVYDVDFLTLEHN